jgi:predicted transposase YbfD/YdcC
MVVKGNHKTLEKKLHFFFCGSCLFGAEFERATQQNIEHGRLETRSILTSSDLPKDYTGFPEVAQAFCLTRKVVLKKTGEIRDETIYGFTDLTSKQVSASDLLTLVRGHWHIENKSHYVRDVTFDEDHSRVRCGNLPQLMASLRNVCIALMRVANCRNIAATCREFAARPAKALHLLGVGRTE